MNRLFPSICILFVLFCFVGYSQRNTEKFRDFKQDGFYHTLNLALNMNKGNEEYVKYLGDYRLDLYNPNFITYLVGNIEYKEGNNSVITNRGFAHFRFIYNKDGIFEPEIFSQLEYNDFLLLKERFLAGSGVRISIYNNLTLDSIHRFSIESGIGLMYEYENVNDFVKPVTKYFRSTNFLTVRYTYNKSVNIFSVTYFQPHIKNFNDFRLLSENRISFSINKFLAFFIAGNLRYDSEPHTNLVNYDLEIANGLTLNF